MADHNFYLEDDHSQRSYTITMDNVDSNLLPSYRYRSSDATVPLWSLPGRTDGSEYFQFEILAEEKLFEEDDEINENATTCRCHMCGIDVPACYIEDHRNGPKHAVFKTIADVSLERVRKQMSQKPPVKIRPSSNTYYCEPCNRSVKQDNRNKHQKTSDHKNNALHDKMLKSLSILYEGNNSTNVLGLQEEINKVSDVLDDNLKAKGEVSKTEPFSTSNDDNKTYNDDVSTKTDDGLGKTVTVKKTNDNSMKTDDDIKRQIDHVLMKTNVRSENIDDYFDIKESGKNADTKNKVLDRKIDAKQATNIPDSKHDLKTYILTLNGLGIHSLEYIDEDYVQINALSGQKIKVSWNNYHGFYKHYHCFVCQEAIVDVATHMMHIKHMKNIMTTIKNKQCLRQIDSFTQHCALCNEIVIYSWSHRNSLKHTNALKASLIEDNAADENRIEETEREETEATEEVKMLSRDEKVSDDRFYCKACQVHLVKGTVLEHIKKRHENDFTDDMIAKVYKTDAIEPNVIIRENVPYNAVSSVGNCAKKTEGDNIFSSYDKDVYRNTAKLENEKELPQDIFVDNYCTVCQKYLSSNKKLKQHNCGTSHLYNVWFRHGSEKLHWHVKVSNEREVICKICEIRVPKSDVFKHLDSDEHVERHNHLLESNTMTKTIKKANCDVCSVSISIVNELDHIQTEKHLRNMAMRTRTVTEGDTKVVRMIVTSKTVLHHHFEPGNNAFTIRCKICNIDIPFSQRNMKKHTKAKQHKDSHKMWIKSNAMFKRKKRFYCYCCDEIIGRAHDYRHITCKNHMNNLATMTEYPGSKTLKDYALFKFQNPHKVQNKALFITKEDYRDNDSNSDVDSDSCDGISEDESLFDYTTAFKYLSEFNNDFVKMPSGSKDSNYICENTDDMMDSEDELEDCEKTVLKDVEKNYKRDSTTGIEENTEVREMRVTGNDIALVENKNEPKEEIFVNNYCTLCQVFLSTEKAINWHRSKPNHLFKSWFRNADEKLHWHVRVVNDRAICKICEINIPRTLNDVYEHIATDEHIIRHLDLLKSNQMIQISEHIVKCQVCDMELSRTQELSHMPTRRHVKNIATHLKNYSEGDQPNLRPIRKVVTDKTKLQYLYELGDDHFSIRCKICKIDIPYSIQNMNKHRKGKDHLKIYFAYLETNTIVKIKKIFYCYCCDEILGMKTECIHTSSKNHIKNLSNMTRRPDAFALAEIALKKIKEFKLKNKEESLKTYVKDKEELNDESDEDSMEFKSENGDSDTKKGENNSDCKMLSTYPKISEIAGEAADAPAAAPTMTISKGDQTHLYSDREIITDKHKIHYLFETVDDTFTVRCRLCKIIVPFLTQNMKEHREDNDHLKVFKAFLKSNVMLKRKNRIFCYCCDEVLRAKKELIHTTKEDHFKKLASMTHYPDNATLTSLAVQKIKEYERKRNEHSSHTYVDNETESDGDSNTINKSDEDSMKTNNSNNDTNSCVTFPDDKDRLSYTRAIENVAGFKNDVVVFQEEHKETKEGNENRDNKFAATYQDVDSETNINTQNKKEEIISVVSKDNEKTQPAKIKLVTKVQDVQNIENEEACDENDSLSLIWHLMENTENPKMVICRLCDCRITVKTKFLLEHTDSVRHELRYQSFLLEHMFKENNNAYFCEACLVDVERSQLFIHANDGEHALNLSAKESNESKAALKVDNQKTDVELNDLDRQIIALTHKRFLMQKFSDTELLCNICKSELLDNEDSVITHSFTETHLRIYNAFLIENEIRKDGMKSFCDVCKMHVLDLVELEHIYGNKHKYNLDLSKPGPSKASDPTPKVTSKAEVTTPRTQNEITWTCKACNITFNGTKKDIKAHNKTVSHKTNVHRGYNTVSKNSVFCSVCKNEVLNIPKCIEIHEKETGHKFSCEERNVNNNQTISKGNVLTMEAEDQSSTLKGIGKEDFKAAENIPKMKQDTKNNINTQLSSIPKKPESRANKTFMCVVCTVALDRNPNIIIAHYDSKSHKDKAKKFIEKKLDESRPSSVSSFDSLSNASSIVYSNTKTTVAKDLIVNGYCVLCNIRVKFTQMNYEKSHLVTNRHKYNVLFHADNQDGEDILIIDDYCKACKKNIQANEKKTHLNSRKHIANALVWVSEGNIDTCFLCKVKVEIGQEFCEICKVKVLNYPVNIESHLNSLGPKHDVPLYATSQNDDTLTVNYYCKVCKINVSENNKQSHLNSRSHKLNALICANEADNTGNAVTANVHCKNCKVKVSIDENYCEDCKVKDVNKVEHLQGSEHEINLAEPVTIENKTEPKSEPTIASTELVNMPIINVSTPSIDNVKESIQTPIAYNRSMVNDWWCNTCKVEVPNKTAFINEHLQGVRHKRLAEGEKTQNDAKSATGNNVHEIKTHNETSKDQELKASTSKLVGNDIHNNRLSAGTRSCIQSADANVDNGTDSGSIYCDVCKVRIPDRIANIHEHLQETAHKENAQIAEYKTKCDVKPLSNVSKIISEGKIDGATNENTDNQSATASANKIVTNAFTNAVKNPSPANTKQNIQAPITKTADISQTVRFDNILGSYCNICKVEVSKKIADIYEHILGKTHIKNLAKGENNTADINRIEAVAKIVNTVSKNTNIQTGMASTSKIVTNIVTSTNKNITTENIKQTVQAPNVSTPINLDKGTIVNGFCDICKVKVPEGVNNINIHLDGRPHKNNEFKHVTNADQYFCEICQVKVPNNMSNINEHEKGAFHEQNLKEKNRAVRKNNLKMVGTASTCTVNQVASASNAIPKISAYTSQHRSAANTVQNIQAPIDNTKRPNNVTAAKSTKTNNSQVAMPSTSKAITNIAASADKNPSTSYVKTNTQSTKIDRLVTKTTSTSFICYVCDIKIPINNPHNIVSHLNGAGHKHNVALNGTVIDNATKSSENKDSNAQNKDHIDKTKKSVENKDLVAQNKGYIDSATKSAENNNSNAQNKSYIVNSSKSVQNKATNINNNIYVCPFCKVEVPNTKLNIDGHLNGWRHQYNMTTFNSFKTSVDTRLTNDTTNRITSNNIIINPDKTFTCNVCDTTIKYSQLNIEMHIQEAIHQSRLAGNRSPSSIDEKKSPSDNVKSEVVNQDKRAKDEELINIKEESSLASSSDSLKPVVSSIDETLCFSLNIPKNVSNTHNVEDVTTSSTIEIFDRTKNYVTDLNTETEPSQISTKADTVKLNADDSVDVDTFTFEVKQSNSDDLHIMQSGKIQSSADSDVLKEVAEYLDIKQTDAEEADRVESVTDKTEVPDIDINNPVVVDLQQSDLEEHSTEEYDHTDSVTTTKITHDLEQSVLTQPTAESSVVAEHITEKSDKKETKTNIDVVAQDLDHDKTQNNTETAQPSSENNDTTQDESDTGFYICNICNFVVSNDPVEVKSHLASYRHGNNVKLQKEKQDSDRLDDLITCDICNVEIHKSMIKIKEHNETQLHIKMFERMLLKNRIELKNNVCYCKVCDLYFNRYSVAMHVSRQSHLVKL